MASWSTDGAAAALSERSAAAVLALSKPSVAEASAKESRGTEEGGLVAFSRRLPLGALGNKEELSHFSPAGAASRRCDVAADWEGRSPSVFRDLDHVVSTPTPWSSFFGRHGGRGGPDAFQLGSLLGSGLTEIGPLCDEIGGIAGPPAAALLGIGADATSAAHNEQSDPSKGSGCGAERSAAMLLLSAALEEYVLRAPGGSVDIMDALAELVGAGLLPLGGGASQQLGLIRDSARVSNVVVAAGSRLVLRPRAPIDCWSLPPHASQLLLPTSGGQDEVVPFSPPPVEAEEEWPSTPRCGAAAEDASKPPPLPPATSTPLDPLVPEFVPGALGLLNAAAAPPTPLLWPSAESLGPCCWPPMLCCPSPLMPMPMPMPMSMPMPMPALGPGPALAPAPMDASEQRRDRLDAMLAQVLQNPPPELADHFFFDGFAGADSTSPFCWMPLRRLFAAMPSLATRYFGNAALMIRPLLGCSSCRVCADADRMALRLRTFEERLRGACEDCMVTTSVAAQAAFGMDAVARRGSAIWSFNDLLALPTVRALFAAADGGGAAPQTEILSRALAGSEVLVVTDAGVFLRPPEYLILDTVEALLNNDTRAQATLASEGEVSLLWLVEQMPVRKALQRLAGDGSKLAIEIVRAAVDVSATYFLDEKRISVRRAAKEGQMATSVDGWQAEVGASAGDGRFSAPSSQSWSLRRVPVEKDSLLLRKLLVFYFEPFSLQHNRVLMACVEAQRRSWAQGALAERKKQPPPVFHLRDLQMMPRIRRILEHYEQRAWPWLLAAALQGCAASPLRIRESSGAGADAAAAATDGLVSAARCSGPRGAWAMRQPVVELTYEPDFRFVETSCPERPEVAPLLQPGSSPSTPVKALPAGAVCVVSYSLSSDISHCQAPKGVEAREAISDSGLEPGILEWEARQQKIIRQLLLHSPDLICVQGLQSIGFSSRCSELDPLWFVCDEEPDSNHLVLLYRQLSKANYAVAFSPTMQLPGSSVTCFGNAVFWKRPRWQLLRVLDATGSAAAVELQSRLGPWRLVACSAKSAAVYAREWGDQISEEDLTGSFLPVQTCLVQSCSAPRSDSPDFSPLLPGAACDSSRSSTNGAGSADVVWCGDFGCSRSVLLPLLAAAEAEQAGGSLVRGHSAPARWRSACESVLGSEQATMASPHSGGPSVDGIFQSSGLEALAALGGLSETPSSLCEQLVRGYPSDHLLQMALLRKPGAHGEEPASGRSVPVGAARPPRAVKRQGKASSGWCWSERKA